MNKSDFGFQAVADQRVVDRLTRLSVEMAPASIAIFDHEMRYILASNSYLEIWGMLGRSVIGMSHYDLFPEIPQRWRDVHARCLAGSSESADGDPFIREDGHVYYFRWYMKPWWHETGEIGGVILYAMDVTAAVEAKRRSADLDDYVMAMLVTSEALLIKSEIHPPDGEMSIREARSQSGSFAGYSVNEIMKMPFFPLDNQISATEQQSLRGQTLARDQMETGTIEYRLKCKNGDWIWVRDFANLHSEPDGIVQKTSVIVDITAEKLQAERLASAHKLLSLGQMASGIGHELAQPLAAMSLAAEVAMKQANRTQPDIDAIRSKLVRISAMIERASGIIDNMKALSRGGIEQSDAVSVSELVSGALSVVHERLESSSIKATVDIVENMPPVFVPGHMYQNIIVNLLANAIDAYEERKSGGAVSNEIRLTARTTDSGGAMLTVRDWAGGIPSNALAHIFDPFYTTKGPDRGTGLGLAVSYSVIRDTGGQIEVENLDGGAAFKILFPKQKV